MDLPLTEFDPSGNALITPTPPALTEPLPERVMMCFFPEVVAGLVDTHGGRRIGGFSRELGGHKIYKLVHDEIPVAVFHPGVGAPLAVQHLERAIAAGGRFFVACGGAGAVRPRPRSYRRPGGRRARRGNLLSLRSTRACHPGRPVNGGHGRGDPRPTRIPYATGTTWTTDAPFRETPARVRAWRAPTDQPPVTDVVTGHGRRARPSAFRAGSAVTAPGPPRHRIPSTRSRGRRRARGPHGRR